MAELPMGYDVQFHQSRRLKDQRRRILHMVAVRCPLVRLVPKLPREIALLRTW